MQSSAASETDYYSRLGLDSDPFTADAMPEFFFVGAQRRFIVQRAVHALYFSGATVLLLGSGGAGKTRTLTEIGKELKDLADICRIDATVLMDAAEIRALLAAALGLPTTVATAGNTELIYTLERMRPTDSDPQPILVAIDAAQLLSIETLVECATLVASAGGRLRLLLAGEADLSIAWQQAQAGAAEVLELRPLSRGETEDYVRTKIQAAGYREEYLLSDAEFDRLYEQSGGNFALINTLMPQLLQPKSGEPTSMVQRARALPLVHIAIAAAVLTIIILLVLYRGEKSESSQQIPLAQPSEIAQPTSDKKNNGERNTVALQLPKAAPTAAPETISRPSNAVRSTQNIALISTEKSAPAATEKNTTIEKNLVQEKLAVQEKPLVQEKSVIQEKPAAQEKTVVTKKEVSAKPESEQIAATSKPDSLNADERALLAMPSSNYVLQLMGAESKTTVDKFAKGAGKGVKLYTYRTKLRGKPWFIVVTGPYADKSAAQTGLEKLPEAIRRQQPWPRTLVNVQADVRAHSGR